MKSILLLLLLVFISCENSNEIKYINDIKENEIVLKDALTDFFGNVFNILQSNGIDVEKDCEEIGNLWNSMSDAEKSEIFQAGADGINAACALALSKHPVGLAVCGLICTIIGFF
jgi:hypothetical protein